MSKVQIDLTAVKRLIDTVWEKNNQLKNTLQTLKVIQKERDELAEKADYKEKLLDEELGKLKQLHQATTEKMEKVNRRQVDDLINTHAQEKQTLIDSYEKKLQKQASELQKENHDLSQSVQKLSKENQAIINRIRGLEK